MKNARKLLTEKIFVRSLGVWVKLLFNQRKTNNNERESDTYWRRSGRPDLLTVKAFRILQVADVVLTDRLVSPEILTSYVSPQQKLFTWVSNAAAVHQRPRQQSMS
jgi:hypothetical protein